jgi:crotonobetainyl-CoA:carnitine CoA-transferase CaiB-like acyl-CoA transferase
MTDLPLTGCTIISFEQYGAAPYATMFLADFGAEIIKIESGEGDFARKSGPQTLGDGDSLYYQTFNLNKRSLKLDLKDAADRALLDAMVADADAVMNNLRGNLPAKLGLDYAALATVNPAIVCGHISAYGRTGSRADWPGYDFLMQAEAGIMDLTGEPDTPPSRVGLSMIDYMTGMMMAYAVVSGIMKARTTGTGMDLDVSLFDAALHQLAYQGSWQLNEGIGTPRMARSAHPSNAPVQLYSSRDGWLYICCMNDKFWTILLDRIGKPELADDPRFRTMAERSANRAALTEVLDAVFATRTSAEWMDVLKGHIPAAPVETLQGALDNPFVAEAEMVADVPHRSGRTLRMLANPLRINGKRLAKRAAPLLDQDGPAIRAAYGEPARRSARP